MEQSGRGHVLVRFLFLCTLFIMPEFAVYRPSTGSVLSHTPGMAGIYVGRMKRNGEKSLHGGIGSGSCFGAFSVLLCTSIRISRSCSL